jgi:hypothetical protein
MYFCLQPDSHSLLLLNCLLTYFEMELGYFTKTQKLNCPLLETKNYWEKLYPLGWILGRLYFVHRSIKEYF